MSRTDVAIIGAGPFGLSLAACLRAAGVDHLIFGRPMQAWSDYMPPGMLMRSEAFATDIYSPVSGVTLADYCRSAGIDYSPIGMALTRETFVDYGRWFQANAVGGVEDAELLALAHQDGGFHLTFDGARHVHAKRVVLAQGLLGFANIPKVLEFLPKPFVYHSSALGDLSFTRGKLVAVVGGGQSALGLAALLREAGATVRLLVRGSQITWNGIPDETPSILQQIASPIAPLGRGWRSWVFSNHPQLFRQLGRERRRRMVANNWGPSGAWWLKDRVVGKVDVQMNTQIRAAQIVGQRIQLDLDDGASSERLITDHVIAATGYRVDMRRQTYLASDIRDALDLTAGAPELSAHFECSVQGLYIIGPASAQTFGPAMRHICGARHASKAVTRHVMRKQSRQNAGLRQGASDIGRLIIDP